MKNTQEQTMLCEIFENGMVIFWDGSNANIILPANQQIPYFCEQQVYYSKKHYEMESPIDSIMFDATLRSNATFWLHEDEENCEILKKIPGIISFDDVKNGAMKRIFQK